MQYLGKIKEEFYRNPLTFSIVVGVLLRVFVAMFNYTPAAVDDYLYVIKPALEAFQIGSDIVVNEIRLNIFAYFFYTIIKFFSIFGINNPGTLIGICYVFLAIFSTSTIVGMHKLGSNYLNKKWNSLLTLLIAIYFFMPIVATKANQTTFALLFIPWSFYFFTKKNSSVKDYFWGAVFLGLTVVVRFQAGIFVIVCGSAFVISYIRHRSHENLQKFFMFILGGLISIALLAVFDILSGRGALSTLYNYISYNFGSNIAAHDYGNSPWYTYIGILLLVFIPPISIIFLYPFIKGIKNAKLIFYNFIVFLIFHSLIANKLERFIIPIIPLFMLITFIGLEKLQEKKLFRKSFIIFFVLNLIFIVPVATARTQMSLVKAANYLRVQSKAKLYLLDIDFWFHVYVGYGKLDYPVQIKKFDNLVSKLKSEKDSQIRLLTLLGLTKTQNTALKKLGIVCSKTREFQPDFLEAVVVKLNPKHNRRRSKTVLYLCKK